MSFEEGTVFSFKTCRDVIQAEIYLEAASKLVDWFTLLLLVLIAIFSTAEKFWYEVVRFANTKIFSISLASNAITLTNTIYSWLSIGNCELHHVNLFFLLEYHVEKRSLSKKQFLMALKTKYLFSKICSSIDYSTTVRKTICCNIIRHHSIEKNSCILFKRPDSTTKIGHFKPSTLVSYFRNEQ